MLAILGALFFLLGLLFLLVTKTETLTVSVSQLDGDRCTVVVAGEADEWAIQTVQRALASPASSSVPEQGVITAASVASSSSSADELAKLAELHESGILGDEEFQAAKARLLDR